MAINKKKRRNCVECIAYYNTLDGERCALGFLSAEELDTTGGGLTVTVHPFEDECETIPQPETKEELAKAASKLGIQWEIEDLVGLEELEEDDLSW